MRPDVGIAEELYLEHAQIDSRITIVGLLQKYSQWYRFIARQDRRVRESCIDLKCWGALALPRSQRTF